MAERRMFAKNIIESDAFYTLDPKEQTLYLHLSMNADDDGVIDNPAVITRACGVKPCVLNSLIEKRFVIRLEHGLVVIKHWKINNYIQRDRYKPTTYTKEFSALKIKENNAYTEIEKPCVSNLDTNTTNPVSNVFTQNRLDKISIDKNSVDTGNGYKGTQAFRPPTVDDIKAYCLERNSAVDADRFFDFYESKGWMVGKNKMKDWKAAVRNWERRDKPRENENDWFDELKAEGRA